MKRALVAAAVFLVARPVLAQEEAEPFGVDYNAPVACPGADAFFGEVRGRTPRARTAREGEKARVLVVRVDARGDRFVGRLAIDDAGTRSTPREVEGATCAEVVGALGLVAALAVDPHASVAPRPAPAASEASTASTPPPAKPASPPEPTPERPREEATVDRPSSASSSSSEQPPRFAVGLGVEISALADAVGSGRVFGEVVLGHGVLAPAIRVALARSLDVDRAARIGTASLRWTTGAVDLCPVRFAIGAGFEARPCAGFALGVLDADGGSIASPESKTRPWAAPDVHARLVWAPIRALSLELEGGIMAPLFRESFFFEPDIPVYEAPAIAGFGRAAASVRFP